ncbi:hypothetical protein B6U79_01255 [Candidatus Bathyarchaeota archaeon ex4484_231]|nr:MAG: hypothetical protein B6U79_01255 [Candidatus Bathyarchaeota archaeon ex4484_231]RJS75316.1 MAG: hypothetical protein CW712_04860 [Candidatus Bathyarchaeota archaeon]
MLNLLSLAALSFVVALSGAAVPGPVFVIVVSETLKKGKKAGPLVVFGHLSIEALIILAVLLGLGALFASQGAKILISYVGGTILVAMGFYLIKTVKNIKGDFLLNENAKFASHGSVAAGFLGSGSNPQFFLWWLATGVPTMALCLASAGAAGFIAFLVGHAAADFFWFGLISYSVDRGRSHLNQKIVRILLIGSAVFLISFGLFLIISSGLPSSMFSL